MKKFLKWIIIFILIITVLMLSLYIYQKSVYTLDKVSFMLNSAYLPENVYIKNYTHTTKFDTYIDIYIKNNVQYLYQKTKSNITNIDTYNIDEYLIINENSRNIFISYTDKLILVNNNVENNVSNIPEKNNFFAKVEAHGLHEYLGIYKYCGLENINGKKCIKVSMTDNNENSIDRNYYYIDLETNLILKAESAYGNSTNDLEIVSTDNYEYYFNSVTDDKMPEFNINDYPDFLYSEI